jgi:hypothetical protein
MICEENGKYAVRLSDPSKKLENIHITLNRALTPENTDAKLSVKCGEITSIDIDLHRSVGRPYTAIFKV